MYTTLYHSITRSGLYTHAQQFLIFYPLPTTDTSTSPYKKVLNCPLAETRPQFNVPEKIMMSLYAHDIMELLYQPADNLHIHLQGNTSYITVSTKGAAKLWSMDFFPGWQDFV